MITELRHNSNPGAPVTPVVKSLILPTLTTLFPPEEVREQARRLGAVQRQGKVDLYQLLMVVILGLMVRGPTAIAQLGHIFNEVTGDRLARSSFWDRFNPGFAQLVRWALDQVVGDARSATVRPPGILACFKDVLAADASVMKVPDELRSVWKGTRRNSAKAALELHAWVRVLTGELVKYKVTAEAFADIKGFGIDHDLAGTLMLFDRGYASPSLWRRIDSVGGYFLTRIPAGWNPEVVSENRRHRGRARKLAGLELRDALDGLKRSIVDVNASFTARVRGYAGESARKVEVEYRVVALTHPETGEYGLYATNVPPRMLRAEDFWDVYRLRWEAETFFKMVKTGSGANEFPSAKRHKVEALLYAGVLRAALAMRAKARQTWVFVRRVNHTQWMRWWNRHLGDALELLLGVEEDLDVEAVLQALTDPNRGRIPTRWAFSAHPGTA